MRIECRIRTNAKEQNRATEPPQEQEPCQRRDFRTDKKPPRIHTNERNARTHPRQTPYPKYEYREHEQRTFNEQEEGINHA